MRVSQILQTLDSVSNGCMVEVEGWLVLVDDFLYVLDDQIESDYKETARIKIADSRRIKYLLLQNISPLGGGESFVFHRVKIMGNFNLIGLDHSLEIQAHKISIENDQRTGFWDLDLSEKSLNSAVSTQENVDDYDFFKEIGLL